LPPSVVHEFFKRRGVTRKRKTAHAAGQDRLDVALKRQAWFKTQPDS